MRTSPNKYAACATRGFTVLEVSLALAILLGAAILLTQFLVASTRQQKLADQRRLALEELSNRLERMKAAKGSEVTAAKLEAGELSAASKARLPGAKLKVFLTASVEERARRRHKQLMEKGIDATLPPLLQDINQRDARDAKRGVAPLLRSDDARLLDTTALTAEQAVEEILMWYRQAQ